MATLACSDPFLRPQGIHYTMYVYVCELCSIHALTVGECFCVGGADLSTDGVGCAVPPHTDLLLVGAACRGGEGGEGGGGR